MRHLILTSLAVFTVSSCYHPLVRVDEREYDSLSQMIHSPLLSELPPDEPVPELHASGGSLTISDDKPFNMSFRGTDLRVALDEISQRAGITMIADAGINGSVDLNFVDISLDDALSTLLKKHDLVLLPGPGNVYFVERNDDPTQVTEFIQLVNVRAADVADNLAALVGDGSKVITDIDRNLVCLIGRQSDVGAVRRYLHHVDTLKDQVLLEVHIFEVSYEDGFNLGAVADASGTVNGNAWNILSAFGQGSAFSSTLSDNDGDLDLTVDAVRKFVGLELVSSPRVLAVTNTKATVDVVQEIPYVQVTATTTGTTGGAGSVVQEEVEFKDAGIKLEITPSIQEAGFLQIDIMQQTSEEVDRFNSIPVIDRRTLTTQFLVHDRETTQFLVHDRETIVLGGLIQTRHSESRTGVPYLMHIPIFGQLFRGDADTKTKQEILIFVTPRILSPSQAAKLSAHYQDEYRETRQDLFFPEMGKTSSMEGPRGVNHEESEEAVEYEDTGESEDPSEFEDAPEAAELPDATDSETSNDSDEG